MKIKLIIALTFYAQVVFSQNYEILITEILADPTPSIGLPEREYIEIFNNTEKAISLKGFKLIYGNFSANFPDSILAPKNYYVVCRRSFEVDFRRFGKVIPLPNFSLPNESSLLVIKNEMEVPIHYVDYKSTWFNGIEPGGKSLEMINLANACLAQSNWSASKSANGGTPGMPNSVNMTQVDSKQPKFLTYNLFQKELTIAFDKNLSPNFVLNNSNFEIIEGDLLINSITFNVFRSYEFTVRLNNAINVGQNAVLLIRNPEDCTGKVGEDVKIDFSNLLPAEKGQILLSEILFNPKAGGEDFIEIFNNSKSSFNLKNWKIANANEVGVIKDIRKLVSYDLKLMPMEYIAFSLNPAFLLQNYPKSGKVIQVPALPAFNNDKGTVILLNDIEQEFDRFNYSESMHHRAIINAEGVSLERATFDNQSASWLSASSDVAYATPGTRNSQMLTDNLQDSFVVEPFIFNPYQGSDLSTTYLKYKVANPGATSSIVVLDKTGRKVKDLANNIILGSFGEIAWDGKGNAGELLPVGYYVFKISTYSATDIRTFFAKCVLGSN